MLSSGAQDGLWPPVAFTRHERELSELKMILADVAQNQLAR